MIWAVYPIAVLTGIGVGLTMPTLNALISNSVSFREQGKVAGVSASLLSLTNVFGPLWAGVSYDAILPSAPYWTGAAFIALAWLLVTRVKVPSHLGSPVTTHPLAE